MDDAELTLDILGARTWYDWLVLFRKWPCDEYVLSQLAAFSQGRDWTTTSWIENMLANMRRFPDTYDFSDVIQARLYMLHGQQDPQR